MFTKIVSLQVMSKDEYVSKKCSSQEVSKIISRLKIKISKEEWQGKEVSLAHLRVIGCDSYVKEKDVARDKLDEKSMKCTFIGYGSNEMGYRFWDSKGHKIVQSSDVTFNEDSLYGSQGYNKF
ncbi:retrovirus-related pol polyprotein from transposon TNT 1-94 [Tanacetum coccineum]|uniref:Retrovirus-related pol polyprotein from transposon TNT 1-94 n=1 Tax=Tanacetum coccineum TaxID=301880 RepID=A0ABQ5I1K9_9ASTR